MQTNKSERYVVVTAVSTHRLRYCIPVSELQKFNPDVDISNDREKQIEWAKDSVTMNEIEESSQHWLGEQIVDACILDEEEIMEMGQ